MNNARPRDPRPTNERRRSGTRVIGYVAARPLEVLVVDDGRVVQSGSHAALLAEGGLYASLYETQFAVRSA